MPELDIVNNELKKCVLEAGEHNVTLRTKELNNIESRTLLKSFQQVFKVFFASNHPSDIVLPQNVDTIGYGAFDNEGSKEHLESITIDGEFESFLSSAFFSCKNLKTVNINSVKMIGKNCFSACTELQSVTIAKNLKTIDRTAFSSCQKLEQIDLPEGLETIGNSAFSRCARLERINIPSSVTWIGDLAFLNCDLLESIVIPRGVKGIKCGTFSGCTKLQSVTLSEGLEVIEPEAFKNCVSLEKITIPSSVKSIDPHTFTGCSKLNEVFIPIHLVKASQRLKLPKGAQVTILYNQNVSADSLDATAPAANPSRPNQEQNVMGSDLSSKAGRGHSQ